jgi:hypothetical protein
MGEPKDTNIFKLSIRKNSITSDIKNPDPTKIPRIKTNDDIKLFKKLYRMKPYKKHTLLDSKKCLFWQKVAKKFGGIEFNPYIHQAINPIKNGKKTIMIMWYYTVDIPSGCIWNLKPIVENIQKMSRSELSANLKNLSNK